MSSDARAPVSFPGSWAPALPVLGAVVAASRARRVVIVGQATDPALREWAAEVEADVVAAPPVPDAECYVVDAAPNHRQVSEALDGVLPHAARIGAVVVVRHVAWPAGHRDHYLDPANLPDGAVHPSTTSFGVRPGHADPAAGGLLGAAGSAWAIAEGGAANGVRPAVEAAIARVPDYELACLPVAFGIGLAGPRQAPYAQDLAARATQWSDPTVEALVATQLDLLDRLLESEMQVGERADAGPRLRNENARLRARVAELEAALAEIASALDTLSYSAVLRAVDLAERPARRNRPGRSFRARLLALRDLATRSGTDA